MWGMIGLARGLRLYSQSIVTIYGIAESIYGEN